jgi:uncharacterized phage protein gp47/JayE
MQLALQNFTTLVQNMAAAVQAAASQALDLTVGSALRAVLEANASVALWMQWLILQVLQTTRAATSTGPDLDSWMADMTLVRLPAVASVGMVTFSRLTPTATAFLPVGALVRSADGSQTFAVTGDSTNSAWSAAAGGYSLAAGLAALTVPVAAQMAGSAGNMQSGAISLMVTAIPGIDAVTNAAPLQNGLDAESDAAFRSRFQNFIQSRSRATPLAIGYAVNSIQQELSYALQENVDTAGNVRMGNFVVTIDDGSGYPSSSLLATAAAAIEAVRPVGSTFAVQPPTVVTANLSVLLTVPSGTMKPPVIAAVATALQAYIDAIPIGASLPLTKVAQVAYAAHPAVVNVGALSINEGTADLTPPASGVIKAGVIAVS